MSKHHKPVKKNDVDYAFISIAFGAASLFTFFLTSLPAVIAGIVALKKKSGNPAQAIWGIVLGIMGPVIAIAIFVTLYFTVFNKFTDQQFSVPDNTRLQMTGTIQHLENYAAKYGKLPKCKESNVPGSCSEWNEFVAEYSPDLPNDVIFDNDADVEAKPKGSIVYANNTTCFVNTPVYPGYLEEKQFTTEQTEQYSALIYFHEGGRACYAFIPDDAR